MIGQSDMDRKGIIHSWSAEGEASIAEIRLRNNWFNELKIFGAFPEIKKYHSCSRLFLQLKKTSRFEGGFEYLFSTLLFFQPYVFGGFPSFIKAGGRSGSPQTFSSLGESILCYFRVHILFFQTNTLYKETVRAQLKKYVYII